MIIGWQIHELIGRDFLNFQDDQDDEEITPQVTGRELLY